MSRYTSATALSPMRHLVLLGAVSLIAASAASAAVTDISGTLTNALDAVVGAGNSARLTANTTSHWNWETATSNIDLNAFQYTINTGGGNGHTYNGAITGPGTLRLDGRYDATWYPDMQLGGTLANTPASVTIVNGRVQLNKTDGVDALAGTITVNTGGTVRIELLKSNQINDSATIDSTASSGSFHLEMDGFNETIGALSMKAGHMVDTGTAGVLKVTTLTVGGVSKPKGAYTASSGFVTGGGYIDVDNFGPPVVSGPPGLPADPSPADGSLTVHPATFTKLTWTAATDATSYDVYFWLASDSKPASPTSNVLLNEYTPVGGVLSLTNYKWQVVAKNSIGTTAGPEWTFSTVDRQLVSGSIDNPNSWIGIGGTATLAGNTTFGWQTGTCAIPAILSGYTLTLNSGGGNAYNYNGNLSGEGGLKLQMAGYWSGLWDSRMGIGGGTGNVYGGPTSVDYGSVSLNKTSGNALCGVISVGSHGNTARLIWNADNQIADDSDVTLFFFDAAAAGYAGRGTFLNLNGHADTIASLTLETGTYVETGTGGVLTVASLTVGGEAKPPGTYTSGNSSFVSGTGSVIVPSGSAAPASAVNSTVAAAPTSVPANGITASTITVTLLDASNNPATGKTVTLASSRGATDSITPLSGVSNGAGVVTFTVKSMTMGDAVLTATDTTDSITVNMTATVTFTTNLNMVDISNDTTPAEAGNPGAGVDIDTVVGVGKTGRLIGLTQTVWWSHGYSVPLDLNGSTLVIDSGNGNVCIAAGAIAGNGQVKLNGGGNQSIRITGAAGNTYTGTTEVVEGSVSLEKTSGDALRGTITVTNGGLIWAANNQINDASPVTLANTGTYLNLAGHPESMGALTVSGDSNIYLGNGSAIVHFADSSAQAWTAGKQLVIREWNGAPGGGGTEGVFFGSSNSGLSADQVAQTGFMNPAGFAPGLYHAAILATGELVPTGTAVTPASPPYDLSESAVAARAAIYTSTGRADLTKSGTPLADGTRIVFFGDSITWQNNYISMLNAAIASGAGTQGKTITLINRGINGGGVLQVRDGAPDSGYPGSTPQASFSSLLTSDQADIAVVFIGINDVWWRGTSAATYEQALRDIAATAAAKGVKLILATPAAHYESPIGADALDPAIDQFSAIVQTVATDTQSTFVNLRSAFVSYWQNNNYEIRLDGSFVTLKLSGLLTYDGVHPTDLGNQMIADHLADGILASYGTTSSYATWAATNAGGQSASQDYDHDGVPNGVEYFMGATGSSFTANPGVSVNGSVRTVTWPRDPAAAASFTVQVSDNLTSWTDLAPTDSAIDTSNPNQVTYTFPNGANRKFCRLNVTVP